VPEDANISDWGEEGIAKVRARVEKRQWACLQHQPLFHFTKFFVIQMKTFK